MALRLFNSLSGAQEIFTPQRPPAVTLYTCGPTVYDYAHIGNLRTFVFYDILRRTLESNTYAVQQVMNITDVGHLAGDGDEGEDKMEKGATREGKTVWDIAALYTEAFLNDMESLRVLPPTTMPKATDHIAEQIALIQQLEKNGHTYQTSDGIYFDTSTFPTYGAMARLDIAGLQEGARVEKNTEKRHATDFALWKFSPEKSTRAMEWDSPWGIGFPGWHIECSAMAMKYLGETIDIHAGGVDHKTVHHTNEIAQSEAVTGKPFARVWMHAEFLMVDGRRMGKSEGNFFTLSMLREKGYEPLAYRYFVLGAHYRSKLNFTWEALGAAQSAYTKLISLVSVWDTPAVGCAEFEQRFFAAMEDDLNTPQALAVMWELVKSPYPSSAKAASLHKMDEILGLGIQERAEELRKKIANAGQNIHDLVLQREKARTQKEYAEADRIRDEIAQMGFAVEDTDDGPVIKMNS